MGSTRHAMHDAMGGREVSAAGRAVAMTPCPTNDRANWTVPRAHRPTARDTNTHVRQAAVVRACRWGCSGRAS
jgi:hypothetical protein